MKSAGSFMSSWCQGSSWSTLQVSLMIEDKDRIPTKRQSTLPWQASADSRRWKPCLCTHFFFFFKEKEKIHCQNVTRFCHPVDVGAGWHQDCSINRFCEDGKLGSISTGGIHKVFPWHFNKVLRLLLRGLNIDCIWAEDLANTLQKSLSKYNIDADPSFSLLFNFSWYLLLFSAESHEDIQNRQRKDRDAAILLHCHPCEQLCSFKSAYPDTDLLNQIPGLISKLSHCDGCAWRSGLLDEPGCYHPALLTLFSPWWQVYPCHAGFVLKLSCWFPFPC